MKELVDLPEAECPRCRGAQGSWGEGNWGGPLKLLAVRLVAKMSRRLVSLCLYCRRCRSFFMHLHVLPRTVVGYHGCHRDFARELVAGRVSAEAWKLSQNDYDWLGEGIYFWEYAPGRAWQWAREHYGDEGAVVATEVRLGRCLDLGDTTFTILLRASYEGTVRLYERNGWNLPKNGGKDFKLRRLDRLVVDRLTEATDRPGGIHYQTVRCPFEEGDPVFAGGIIKTQSHVQIAVRERNCIASRVYPVDSERG